MRAVLLCAAAVLAVAAPSVTQAAPAAPANPAACLWSTASPALREAMEAKAPSLGAMLEPVNEFQVALLLDACHLNDRPGAIKFLAHSLVGHALLDWSARELQSRGVSAAVAENAWNALPAASRTELGGALEPGQANFSQATLTAIAQQAANLKLGDDATGMLFNYVIGRAVVARAESEA
jgi:hypothetical protein